MRAVSLSALAAMTVLTPSAALAQGSIFEEIMVTAQKREQSLSDVGIAVTAFTGQQIEALGFETSTDIAALAPGVFTSAGGGGQNNKFTIRGVTQNDFTEVIEAPIAVYLDEAYLAPQQGQLFGMFDLERVEILRGPQGTLFGRNATGGLVHYVTAKPSLDEVEGFTEIQYGSYDQVRLEAAINIPISEKVAVRSSGFFDRNDPYIENLFPDGYVGLDPDPGERADLNGLRNWGLRSHLYYESDSGFTALLSAHISETKRSSGAYEARAAVQVFDENGSQVDTIYASPTETREAIGADGEAVAIPFNDGEIPGVNEDATRPVPGGDLFGYIDPDPDDRKTSFDYAEEDVNHADAMGATLNLALDVGDNMTLTSISDVKIYDRFDSTDTTGSAASQFYFISYSETDTFAQELRLSGDTERMRWVGGLYFLAINNITDTGLSSFDDSPLTFFPPPFGLDDDLTDAEPGPGVDLVTELTLDTRSYSVFGQIDYDISDTLTLTVGGRIVSENKDYSFAQNSYVNENVRAVDTGTLGIVISPYYEDEFSDLLWAGKIQLDYKPNDDLLLYAGINRGVKAGSINGPIVDGAAFDTDLLEYGPEVLLSYEAGFKASLLDGAMRVNGSVYHYDYDGYQAFTFTNFSGLITNQDAKYTGAELDVMYSPATGLDLYLAASYIDATVYDLEVSPGVFRDVEPNYTPDFQLSGFIRYGLPFMGGQLAFQFDGNYMTDHYYNSRNFSAHVLEGYFLGNVRVSWISDGGQWETRAFVSNIANKANPIEGFDTANLNGNVTFAYGRPRWFGGSVRYNF